MKHKMTFAAAILSVPLLAGGAFAMQGMDKAGPMMQGKHHMMMLKKIDKAEDLSEATKKLLKGTIEAKKEKRQASRDAMKTYRDEMKAIMTAEKFDKAAYLAKKAEQNAMMSKKQAEHAEVMANIYEKMTAKERQAWMKLKKGPKGKHHKMRGKGQGQMKEAAQ